MSTTAPDPATEEKPSEVQQTLGVLLARPHADLQKLEYQVTRLSKNPGRVKVDRELLNELIRFVGAVKRSKAA